MRYQIIRNYEIAGKSIPALCYDAGSAFTFSETEAKQRVEALHQMGYTDARYEELPQGKAWFDDNNWIG